MIVVLTKLNKKKKQEVKDLVNICLQEDGLEKQLYLDNDINLYENLPCFYLYYKDNKLVSVLTVQQEKEEEVEITGYTLPSERNKGYFTSLLERAEDELIQFNINKIVLSVEPKSKTCEYILEYCDASYDRSEYLLELNMDFYSKQKNNLKILDGFNTEELDSNRLEDAILLSSDIFNTEYELSADLLKDALINENIYSLLGIFHNKLIGVCNVYIHENFASIFGIGIQKEEQGRGLGTTFLLNVLEQLEDKKVTNVSLQVSGNNVYARKLYHKFGFMIKSQYDYYSYEIEFDE